MQEKKNLKRAVVSLLKSILTLKLHFTNNTSLNCIIHEDTGGIYFRIYHQMLNLMTDRLIQKATDFALCQGFETLLFVVVLENFPSLIADLAHFLSITDDANKIHISSMKLAAFHF